MYPKTLCQRRKGILIRCPYGLCSVRLETNWKQKGTPGCASPGD
jgi:hypothetical protein